MELVVQLPNNKYGYKAAKQVINIMVECANKYLSPNIRASVGRDFEPHWLK